MRRASLQIIRDEHASLAAMLQALGMMLQHGPGERRGQYFEVVRAMLFYIAEVPERQHHPRETEHLFPRVVTHCPALQGVVAQLDEEHRLGAENVARLQHALLAWELLGEAWRDAFERDARAYLEFHERHMSIEETQILPAAERCLDEADWAVLDAGFGANHDPLDGWLKGQRDPTANAFHALFSQIVARAPAPVGLAEEGL